MNEQIPSVVKRTKKLSQSIAVKALIVGFLTLILLIPSAMIQNLIRERKYRSQETIMKINDKWSRAQTLCAPILSIPYTGTRLDVEKRTVLEHHTLHIMPENLEIETQLFPEERHYGIYKTILYKSDVHFKGHFEIPEMDSSNTDFHWDRAYIRMGFSDLRGITNNIDFRLNERSYAATAGGNRDEYIGQELIIQLNKEASIQPGQPLTFLCAVNLNGSNRINFIPVGKTTRVHVAGAWKSPGYIGDFSPEYTLDEKGFSASWSVLHFNRNIPDRWVDNNADLLNASSFGVSLVDTVDHYQQNTRSAKYAIMFIALTFTIFFFVEILTKKRIHPIQYLLVGFALILFYSLLLSLSEQVSFARAYFFASLATIGLITFYTKSIFKNWKQTSVLTFTLCLLYIFLFVVLRLEDIALLIGSIGLFIILGIIMYCSRRINWYKEEDALPDVDENRD